jgi:transposase-like protein
MIQAKCPSCKKTFTVRINRMGKKVQCKFCGKRFVVGETPSS